MTFSNNGKGNPDPAPQLSLTEEMAELADEMRQLQTDFGQRPYRVFSVTTQWSAGEIYRGDESVICEKEFLPTPFVDLRPMYTTMTEAGRFEHGDIVLREVSPSLTEDQIRELCFNGVELPPGQQGFIEIRYDSRKGGQPERRRFSVRGVPWHDAERFEWVVTLSDEEQPRNRDGSLKQEHLVNPPVDVYRPS